TGNTFCSKLPQPVGLKIGNSIANHWINIKPNQKFGIDSPNSAITIIATSSNVYFLTAEIIPTKSPQNIQKIIEMTDSSRVIAKRALIWSNTGMLSRIEEPKSSCTTFPKNLKYCS